MLHIVFALIALLVSGAPDHYATAMKLQAAGKHEEAIAELDKAIADDPSHGMSWMALGQLHGNAGRHDKAVVFYERATELMPDRPIL